MSRTWYNYIGINNSDIAGKTGGKRGYHEKISRGVHRHVYARLCRLRSRGGHGVHGFCGRGVYTYGAGVLRAFIGTGLGLGTNGLYDGSVVKSLVIEIVLTFIFVLAVLGATSKIENGSVAGLVIGGSLTLVHLMGIYFTGTSVNLARSFGPALFLGGTALVNVWVFIVAPLVGGALAAVIWRCLADKKDN